ncbi:MAG: NADH-quinone oxidoreductase subunit C [Opitutaceae bacterium]|nr:NADH-quinone oxidoreductase subunit C [Opitutaceae bacterium]
MTTEFNIVAGLQRPLAEVRKMFRDRIGTVHAPRPNELYVDIPLDLAAGFCAHLHRKWSARLVSVFADDVRDAMNTAFPFPGVDGLASFPPGGSGAPAVPPNGGTTERTGDDAKPRGVAAGVPHRGVFHLYYVYALDQRHGFIIARAAVPADKPEFPSLTDAVHGVNWQEREIQDLFGLKLLGHPNPRRCALHDDWPEVFPLRKDFDLRTKLPPFQGPRHKFREVEGEGVFQVPVGPVHAGIIEPGHFLFSVAGEPVLYLQLRMFYVHKGTEKLFESLPVAHGVRLAESISGDSSFAHATAFCHAVERAAEIEPPPRARALRTLCLELERIYNHLGDIGAICTDVAFVTAHMHALRLKERVMRLNEHLTGNRLLRGMACLGGVRFDFDESQLEQLAQLVATLQPEFAALVELIRDSSGTRDRLETTGVLTPDVARDLGIVGLAGRASGVDRDLRRDFPHAFYEQLRFDIPVLTAGDVQSRLALRREEIFQSFAIINQVAAGMPDGPIRTAVGDIPPDRTALGYVEGWRGEIFHWVRTAPGNRLARCKVKDPSLQNWPALTEAILGNIVPDFPVVNKSFNLSYSGTDR